MIKNLFFCVNKNNIKYMCVDGLPFFIAYRANFKQSLYDKSYHLGNHYLHRRERQFVFFLTLVQSSWCRKRHLLPFIYCQSARTNINVTFCNNSSVFVLSATSWFGFIHHYTCLYYSSRQNRRWEVHIS